MLHATAANEVMEVVLSDHASMLIQMQDAREGILSLLPLPSVQATIEAIKAL